MHHIWGGNRMEEKEKSFVTKLAEQTMGRSYYPELERKPFAERLMDNLRRALKDREVDEHYLLYGLDIKGADMKSFITYREVRHDRDRANKRGAESSQILLLRDKFLSAPWDFRTAICFSIRCLRMMWIRSGASSILISSNLLPQ